MNIDVIRKTDPEIADVIINELNRQRGCVNLIASENYTSPAVIEAMGSVLTNKYSEGYPYKRYYGGNQFVDVSETLAIERAKKLFGADHANVQPNAGSPANMAAYYSLLNYGDKIMGMSLAHGGHLTHGSPVNFSGKLYKIAAYGVDKETERLDYDAIRKQALEEKPDLILCGYTAYPREIDFKAFADIANEVDAWLMADIAHIAGLIAGKAHPSPVPYCDVVTTTTHKTLRGPRSGLILCKKDVAEKVDKAVFPGLQGGPLDHIIAAKAVCFKEAMTPEFAEYAKQIVKNARALSDELIAGGLRITTGGTDNHLLLVDVTPKKVTGKQAQDLLDEVSIVVNKNMIPYDTRKPFDPSGIRVGTPSLTTRGMKESEMKEIGQLIIKMLDNPKDNTIKEKVKESVKQLCGRFPLYTDLRT
jgi:glycine hydroxymethyltransferase